MCTATVLTGGRQETKYTLLSCGLTKLAASFDPDTFGFLISDLARLFRGEMDRRTAEDIGLTAGESRALAHAARAGAVRQNVLAERMGLEPMTVSSYLDRLEARGFIERHADPTDRRAKIVRLTPAASPVLDRIRAVSAGVRTDASQGMTAAEWEQFIAMLKQARANLTPGRTDAPRGGEASL